ncbi:hypothetical protein F511_15370 [Dorcoceras hygrometricum]|uniref:Uncharacterized protein n=1 Tax=Dorcoceras hygrometricum TaxID=472368 RepID=A0A2Z7C6M8_9LAMI|nr:hypothetical protein F511_15370 [Dorcoceras hygrometricum]
MRIQQMRRGARYGMSCDDISPDVITISSWLSADEAKRKRRCDVRFALALKIQQVLSRELLFISRSYLEIGRAKRCRLHKLIRQRFAIALKIQREDFALLFHQSKDSVARFQQKRKRSSSRHESAGAKQLTIYEELRELDVNC